MTTDEKMIAQFLAVDGIPVNPELPAGWDNTPHEDRPECHRLVWGRSYVVSVTRPVVIDVDEWWAAWPDGVRYDVRCLDGGAWDRSTVYGSYGSLDAATAAADARLGVDQ